MTEQKEILSDKPKAFPSRHHDGQVKSAVEWLRLSEVGRQCNMYQGVRSRLLMTVSARWNHDWKVEKSCVFMRFVSTASPRRAFLGKQGNPSALCMSGVRSRLPHARQMSAAVSRKLPHWMVQAPTCLVDGEFEILYLFSHF